MKKSIIRVLGLPLAALATLAAPEQAQAQTVPLDSARRPAAYASRNSLFEAYPKSRKDIIFLGNSITAGTDWHELLQNPRARNRGISGDITFGVLERLDGIVAGKPDKIFILIGINDLEWNTPVDLILKNYSRIIRKIKEGSPGTGIYFQTLLPVNPTFKHFKNAYRNKEADILRVNAGLKGLAQKEKITLIDLYPHFLDGANRLKPEYTYDGLHLSPAGYTKWAELLKAGKYLD